MYGKACFIGRLRVAVADPSFTYTLEAATLGRRYWAEREAQSGARSWELGEGGTGQEARGL
jgi:hypothetical protein